MEKLTAGQIATIVHLTQKKFSGTEFTAVAIPLIDTADHESVTMEIHWFKADSDAAQHEYTGNVRGFLNGLTTVSV